MSPFGTVLLALAGLVVAILATYDTSRTRHTFQTQHRRRKTDR